MSKPDSLVVHSVTPDRWDDLERLFGPSGAYSGCWCMFLRVSAKEFDAGAGATNRSQFAAVVASGTEPGLLAYENDAPVGWVAVAPRREYPRVLRSPLHKPGPQEGRGEEHADDQADDHDDVWAVSCFFITKPARGYGIARHLLDAAVEFARERGAHLIEGYPSKDGGSPAEMWRGSIAMYSQAGFGIERERRAGRPVMSVRVT